MPRGEATLLEKAVQVERETVPTVETRASSRSSVVPVRCGFSRFSRSISSASCGVRARDCPRSRRVCGAKAAKPPRRYRSAQSSKVSTEREVRWEYGIS